LSDYLHLRPIVAAPLAIVVGPTLDRALARRHVERTRVLYAAAEQQLWVGAPPVALRAALVPMCEQLGPR